jgi:hypothetical protein
MTTRESQKRASKAWYERNKEHCYELTKKWREDHIDLWRQKANEYSKRCSQRKRDFAKEARRLLEIQI